ncbi:hypothetical protein G9A89_018587 [Geosiphon pyriformis]|nr:hypothetical protein G9A89_018587 [Geosiphon pyriformis]
MSHFHNLSNLWAYDLSYQFISSPLSTPKIQKHIRSAKSISKMSTTKLGVLLVRTIAKPIASSLKVRGKIFLWYLTYTFGKRFSAMLLEHCKNHPRFRSICISIAQATHRIEMQLKLNLLNLPSEKIRPLNDVKAIEVGANFIGEAIIFGVAGSLIIWEQTRTYKQNKERNYQIDETIGKLKEEVAELRSNLEKNHKFQDQLEHHLNQTREDNDRLRNLLNRMMDKGLLNKGFNNSGSVMDGSNSIQVSGNELYRDKGIGHHSFNDSSNTANPLNSNEY